MTPDNHGHPGAGHQRQRTFFYRGTVPGGLGGLLLLPALLVFTGVAALVAVGGLVVPLVLPLIRRKRGGGHDPADPACIELDPRDYRTIDTDSLPRR